MAKEVCNVKYQFRVTDNQGNWSEWTDCYESMYNKIKDGLRTGWRKTGQWEVRVTP